MMNLLSASFFFAYVGPGAGLTMLGALATVLMILLLALMGPILYPIKLIRSWLRSRKAAVSPQE